MRVHYSNNSLGLARLPDPGRNLKAVTVSSLRASCSPSHCDNSKAFIPAVTAIL